MRRARFRIIEYHGTGTNRFEPQIEHRFLFFRWWAPLHVRYSPISRTEHPIRYDLLREARGSIRSWLRGAKLEKKNNNPIVHKVL